jgi:hypothetical protein
MKAKLFRLIGGPPSLKRTMIIAVAVSALPAYAIAIFAVFFGTSGSVPRPLYLTAVPFNGQARAETLEETRSDTQATKGFTNSSAIWISLTTYDEGTIFLTGDVKFSIEYRATSCSPPQYCKVSVDWGWCAADCSTLTRAVTFKDSGFKGDNEDMLSASNTAKVVLSACPCHVYVAIASRVAPGHNWTLVYGSGTWLQMPLQTGGSSGQMFNVVAVVAIGFVFTILLVIVVMPIAWIVHGVRARSWPARRKRTMLQFAQSNGLASGGAFRWNGTLEMINGNWKGLQISCADIVDTDYGIWYSKAGAQIAANLPSISIDPGGGDGNVRLESGEFDRRFAVTTESPEFAFQLIDPRMVQNLLSKPSVGYEVGGSTVVATCPGLTTPEQLLDALLLFVESIPRLVWTQYGTGAAA